MPLHVLAGVVDGLLAVPFGGVVDLGLAHSMPIEAAGMAPSAAGEVEGQCLGRVGGAVVVLPCRRIHGVVALVVVLLVGLLWVVPHRLGIGHLLECIMVVLVDRAAAGMVVVAIGSILDSLIA